MTMQDPIYEQLKKADPDGRDSGAIFEGLRKAKCPKGRAEAAQKILGDPQRFETIRAWEESRVDGAKLDAIRSGLGLTADEYRHLYYARFPALYARWLEDLPPKYQCGLLLKAYRELKGLTQAELGKALSGRVYQDVVSDWEEGVAIPGNMLPQLQRILGLSEHEYGELLKRRFPAFDPKWLNAQPEPKRAGLLLRAYRELKGLPRETLGKMPNIDSAPDTIKDWENGDTPIPGAILCGLKTALGLTLKEFIALRDCRLPALDERWLARQPLKLEHDYLLEAYHALKDVQQSEGGLPADILQKLKYRCFPALFDKAWLDTQPVDKQAGLLIKSHRELSNRTQADVAKALGFMKTDSTLSAWERGAMPIPGSKLSDLKNVLHLAHADYITLRERRFPALQKEWLQQQPVHTRAGLLLRTYEQLMGFDDSQLAEQLGGISGNHISHWACGVQAVSARNGTDRLTALCKCCRAANALLPENERWFDEEYFRAQVEVSNLAIRATGAAARRTRPYSQRHGTEVHCNGNRR